MLWRDPLAFNTDKAFDIVSKCPVQNNRIAAARSRYSENENRKPPTEKNIYM